MPSVRASDSRRTSQRGSSMVEMALVIPIFFLLIFGVVSLGLVFFGYSSAVYGTRQAIRYAMVHGSNSSSPATAATLTTIVKSKLWGAPNGTATVSSVWSPDNSAGSVITVSVTIVYKTPIPFSSLNTVSVGTKSVGIILF